MRMILPNGDTVDLDFQTPLKEKRKVVDGILSEWNDYFKENWSSPKVKVCLDIMGHYLSRSKVKDDELISRRKFKHMLKGDSRTCHFDRLNYNEKLKLGIIIEEDE